MLPRQFTQKWPNALGRRSLAGVLLLHLLAVVVLSVAPDLHALIHEHAHDEEHACAVTLFQTGQVATADPTPLQGAVRAWVEVEVLPGLLPWVTSLGLRGSAPGRSPPVAVG